MLQIKCFTFNALHEHTYVLYDNTRACAIIDPGCSTTQEEEALSSFLSAQNLQLERVLNTHGHIDHTVGNHYLHARYGITPEVHIADLPLIEGAPPHAASFGLEKYVFVQPNTCLQDLDQVTFGATTLRVLHVPGHSPGHVAFYHETTRSCWVGDILFKNTVGRTDLPGGEMETLLRSIKNQLLSLPATTQVYAGHGPLTTIGEEAKNNPYLQNA